MRQITYSSGFIALIDQMLSLHIEDRPTAREVIQRAQDLIGFNGNTQNNSKSSNNNNNTISSNSRAPVQHAQHVEEDLLG